jgi:hypothetical protein
LRLSLDETPDPTARQLAFHNRLLAELRPFYLTQRRQDRAAIKRARRALTPSYRKTLRAKLIESFIEDGVQIALRSDIDLLRQALRGFHMLEHPDKWLAKPQNLARVLQYWMRGRKRNAGAYPPKPGPERVEMLKALAVDYQADIDRIAQAA